MTGSSSKQWDRLAEAGQLQSKALRAQPDSWWKQRATSLLENCLSQGFPTTRQEAWKYTSLAPLNSRERIVEVAPVQVAAPDGVRVACLSELVKDRSLSSADQAAIRSLLDVSGPNYFENLAMSFVLDPCVILVPANFHSDESIDLHWQSLPEGHWGLGAIAVVVGEGAAVTVVERYGQDADAQASATLMVVGALANVSHLRIQSGANEINQGIVLAATRTHLRKDAKYEVSQVSFGSRFSREDLTVELEAEGAETVTDGVFIGRAGQVLDHHTNLVHRVGPTTSRQIYKGILADESRGIFNGRIAIAKNASGSNSSQMNKNLLLSKKVEIDTKPQLEIDNDDVKAAHGAAIGRLDPEHIFYLRSRGIDMGHAVEMLARGFAFEAVQRLSSENLRTIGQEEIERGLRGLSWEAL